MSVEVVLREPKKPLPEEVAKRWAQEWAKEGEQVDWQRLMPSNVFDTNITELLSRGFLGR